jgi:histidinol phosphatase-like PHP family hydrolase
VFLRDNSSIVTSRIEKPLAADFHNHTTFSDGRSTPQEVIAKAQERGLNLLALADHNTVAGIIGLNNSVLEKLEDVQVMVGTELSFDTGHYLILGIPAEKLHKQLEKWGIVPQYEGKNAPATKQLERECFQWVVDNGGIVIAAHPAIPFQKHSASIDRLVEFSLKGLIHGTESHNAHLEKKAQDIRYPAWHATVQTLSAALGVPDYANSDSHTAETVGDWHNKITVPEGMSLLEAMREKKISVKHVARKK